MKRGRKMFNPTGPVDLSYKFVREGAGWRRELEVRPKQGGMMYEKFRYPISDVRGKIKKTTTHAGGESTTIDLRGTAAGQLITVTGRIDGDGPDPAVSVRVRGDNVPLDEHLYAALSPEYAALVSAYESEVRQ